MSYEEIRKFAESVYVNEALATDVRDAAFALEYEAGRALMFEDWSA